MDSFIQPSRLQILNVVPYGSWFLYILVAFVVFVVVMMLMGKRIRLDWFDFRPKRNKVLGRAKLYWQPGPEYTNLTIPSRDAVNITENRFSILFDCVLYNSREYKHLWTNGGPYRHILHRGSNELAMTTVGGRMVKGCATPLGEYAELPPFGLPKRMNPGIFLDPVVNDILVFVDVAAGADTYRESVRITDMPLDIPFRLGVVMNGSIVEVYINCRLEFTKILSGEPKRVENEWYGLAGSASAQAQIQNMYIWSEPLVPGDITTLCPAIPSFVIKRPLCESSELPKSKPSPTQPDSLDLGLRKKLSSCPL